MALGTNSIGFGETGRGKRFDFPGNMFIRRNPNRFPPILTRGKWGLWVVFVLWQVAFPAHLPHVYYRLVLQRLCSSVGGEGKNVSTSVYALKPMHKFGTRCLFCYPLRRLR